jgi:hypothetical protein
LSHALARSRARARRRRTQGDKSYRACSRDRGERLETDLEPDRIGTFVRQARLKDRGAVESLEPAEQHRTIVLVEESPSDVDNTSWIDEQVPVKREVVDRAQRDPVRDRCDAAWFPVIDDVRSLEKLRFSEAAHRTPG